MNLTQRWTQCSNLAVYQVCFFLGAKKGEKKWRSWNSTFLIDTFQKKHKKSVLLHLGVSNCQAVLTQFYSCLLFSIAKSDLKTIQVGWSPSPVYRNFPSDSETKKSQVVRGFSIARCLEGDRFVIQSRFLTAICMPGEASNHFSERHQHHKGSRTS